MLTFYQMTEFHKKGYVKKFPDLYLAVGQHWESKGKAYVVEQIDSWPEEMPDEVHVHLRAEDGELLRVDGGLMVICEDWRLRP